VRDVSSYAERRAELQRWIGGEPISEDDAQTYVMYAFQIVDGRRIALRYDPLSPRAPKVTSAAVVVLTEQETPNAFISYGVVP
jgi:hypothetical protein